MNKNPIPDRSFSKADVKKAILHLNKAIICLKPIEKGKALIHEDWILRRRIISAWNLLINRYFDSP